jgi:hypothetical protein
MPAYPSDIISTRGSSTVVVDDGDQVECCISSAGALQTTVTRQ